jgi:site-specific recombinase XerD
MGYYQDLFLRELKTASLSVKTQNSYIRTASVFFEAYSQTPPAKISETDVHEYLLSLKERGLSSSSLNVAKSGLRFFYTHVLPRNNWVIFNKFKPGKSNDRRPALSVRETWALLNSVKVLQHRSALTTIYLCGLRISECVSLQIGDVHFDESRIHVHRSKGAKSRYIPLARKTLNLLKTQWDSHQGKIFIFPSKSNLDAAGIPSTLNKVFKLAASEAGITKRGICVHSLRHSYATHLLDLGVPTEHVKVLMGHSNITTTEKYLHITKSGFDQTKRKVEILAEPCFDL